MDRRPQTSSPTNLELAQDRFIAQWGQMGSIWGISRTMAEVHALLYIAGKPMNTDEVMNRLHISRGNGSMSLRALCEWGIVTKVHLRGERKEYFQADQDVWALCRKIIHERLRREIHPLLASLYEIRDMTQQQGDGVASEHNRRLDALLDLVRTIDSLGERFVGGDSSASDAGIRLAVSMLARLPHRRSTRGKARSGPTGAGT